MKILMFTTSFPQPNDWARAPFNLNMCLALAANHEVCVIVPMPWHKRLRVRAADANRPEWSRKIHVQYPTFYYPPGVCRWSYAHLMRLGSRWATRNVTRGSKPDVVVGYWAFPDGAVAGSIARALRVPHVQIVGGSDLLLPARGSSAARRVADVLRRADHVVTVSRHLMECVLNIGVSSSKVSLISNGVDTQLFSPGSRGEARRRIGIPDDDVVLLWVGRMVPVKGLDVLLEASHCLAQSGIAHRLLLVGDGPLRAELRKKSEALRLEVEFRNTVPHEDLPDYYRAADLTVLSSHSEGIPNVLRESIACGTPFVGTHVGGVPEVARDGIDELTPAADPQAFAAAIERLLNRRDNLPASVGKPSATSWAESAETLMRIVRRTEREVRYA